ncbi:MAG: TIGR02001 family outer membrane protein [Oceanicaulis sp. HLUCCA04]|nr:MAG: TIGR02001 family outer membrane protein [Oceanicaulis sp. HLUCCA04]
MRHFNTLSRRATTLATLLAVSASTLAFTSSVQAQEGVEIEANVALVSDYRFRGISLSDRGIAVQGGFDLAFDNGFYAGTWASSIEPVGNSEIELDLYAGYGFEAGGFAIDVGALVYTYPGATDVHYWEFYGSAGFTAGVLESTLGAAYAPDQDNIGNDDNLYVYYEGAYPLGESGLSLTGSVGYETGAFGDPDGDGDDKWDWSLGIGWAALGVDWSLAYVATTESTDEGDATAVLMISKAF